MSEVAETRPPAEEAEAPRRSLLSRLWVWMLLAFLIRLGYLAEQSFDSPLFNQPLLDEAEAVESARQLLAGEGFGPGPLFKAPGYPVFLAGVMAIFGSAWPVGIRFLQHLLGALLAGMAGDTARRLIPAGKARALGGALAAAAIAVYAPLIRLEACVCLDFLVAFLQSGMLWCLVRWCTGSREGAARGRWMAAAGLFAAVAWLTRPTLTVVLPLLAAWIMLAAAGGRLRGSIRPRGRAAFLFLVFPVLAMAAVYLRNMAAGEPKLMPWQGGFNFYHANRTGATGRYLLQTQFVSSGGANPTASLARDGWQQAVAQRRAPAADPGQVYSAIDAYWFGLAREDISAAPGRWLRLMGRKLLYLVSDKEIYNYEEYDLQRSLSRILPWLPGRFGLIWPFALASLELVWRLSHRRRLAGAGVAVYFIGLGLAIALYYTSGRMRMPLVFPAAVSAAAGLSLLLMARPAPLRLWYRYGALLVVGAAMSWGDWWGVRSERMWHADLARMSNAAWRDGRPKLALEFADRAAVEAPDYPMIPLLRGQALYALGQFEAAGEAFRKAMEVLPTDPVAPYNLGIILQDSARRPEEAARMFEEALRRNVDYHQAAWRGALAWLDSGDAARSGKLLEPYRPILTSAGPGARPVPSLLLVAGVAHACATQNQTEALRLAGLLDSRGLAQLKEELARLKLESCVPFGAG